MEAWLRNWEKIYTECKDLKLSEVEDDRPLYDFLNAISSVDAQFSKIWMIKIETKTKKGKKLPDLHELIEYFRNDRRLTDATKGRIPQEVFNATFQGNTTPGQSQKDCVCGEKHLFPECLYLIETLRPKDWKPDPAIQKQIEEKLKKIPKLKKAVKRIQKEQKELAMKKSSEEKKTAEEPVPSAYTASTSTSDYHLRDSFILDSGASIHICNRRSRFQDLRPASEDDVIYAGNTIIPIEGFGSVKIIIQAPDGPREIMLTDVALVPTFHTNVASLRRFKAKGTYWDTQNDRLVHREHTVCSVTEKNGQWILEYNEPINEDGSFPARSAQPRPDSEGTGDTWHRRLGHLGPDAIEKLSTSTLGAAPVKGPTTIQCEVCSVSKA